MPSTPAGQANSANSSKMKAAREHGARVRSGIASWERDPIAVTVPSADDMDEDTLRQHFAKRHEITLNERGPDLDLDALRRTHRQDHFPPLGPYLVHAHKPPESAPSDCVFAASGRGFCFNVCVPFTDECKVRRQAS